MHPLKGLLELAKLPRSTFYYRQKAAARPDRHAMLKEAIKTIFDNPEPSTPSKAWTKPSRTTSTTTTNAASN
ncbi:hypothetical protein [Mesorhizobium sp. M8A.F.Ca.ET.213.01.1.1]|uniref:hypothetical protein n=1 Tax=Mesorhizobium sp. M8A.F.Ca.ET.213.01.1.1 TaxID=2563970 RepID=UPI001091D2F9